MSYEPTQLDLFSGIGGFALAAQWAGFRTIGFCEIDKYCQKVLAKNFLADTASANGGRWTKEGWIQETAGTGGKAPIFGNIFDFDGRAFYGVDLITGGFPCQPFSVAGKRRGAADDRAIWPQMFRVISEARPAWVLGENVPGIIPMELDNVLSDLESIGYATRSFVIPACAVDAKHRRDRLWIIGRRNVSNSDEQGLEGIEEAGNIGGSGSQRTKFAAGFSREQDLSNPKHQQFNWRGRARNGWVKPADCCEWLPEPDVGGSSNGLSRELDAIGLSNEAKTRANTILRDVLGPTFEEALREAIRRFDGVSETEILLAFLCKYEMDRDEVRLALEGRATAIRFMRSLWREIESARSPYQRRYNQQFAQQYSDALRQLPRETSSLYPQAWASGYWEDGIARVAHKIPSRVDRLKGLGNAIVPQVAYEILKEIRKLV